MEENTVDSLRLEIESDANDAVAGLERLTKQMVDLQKSLNFDLSSLIGLKNTFADLGKESSIADVVKSVEDLKKATRDKVNLRLDEKSVEEKIDALRAKFKDVGIDFKFSGDSSELEKEIARTESKLNDLFEKEKKKISLGQTEGAWFESLEYDISETLNRLENLRSKLNEVSASSDGLSNVQIHLLNESDEKTLEDYVLNLERYKNIISAGGIEGEDAGTYMPFAEISHDLDSLQEKFPKAIELARQFEDLLRSSANEPAYEEVKFSAEGAENAVANLARSVGQVTAKLSEMSPKVFDDFLSKLSVPPVNTENLKRLESDLDRAEQKYESLKAKFSNALLLHDINSEPVRRIQVEIEKTERTIDGLQSKIQEVKGNAGNVSGLDRFRNILSEISNAALKMAGAFGSGALTVLRNFGGVVKKLIGNLKNLAKSMLGLKGSSKKMNASLSGSLKTLLKYGLGIRSLFVLVNKLRAALVEGFGNLAQFSERVNGSISDVKSGLTTLKNALAAAFEPIVSIVSPILKRFIGMMVSAANSVGMLMAALTGRGYAFKALPVTENYAAALAGVDKNAQKAKKSVNQLLSIDELNIISPDEEIEESAGAGAEKLDPDSMFDVVPIEQKWLDFADWLKDMWGKSNFFELGEMLGQKLLDALRSIPWDSIKEQARKIGRSLATLINGFISVEGLGYEIGKTFAEAVNTGFEFLHDFVRTLDWGGLGTFFAERLNGLFENLDLDLIRSTFVTLAFGISDLINNFVKSLNVNAITTALSSFVNTVVQSLRVFFVTADWESIGETFGTFLSQTIEGIDWTGMGKTLGIVAKSIFEFFDSAITNVKWEEVGYAIRDFLEGIDWTETLSSLGDLIKDALIAAIQVAVAALGGEDALDKLRQNQSSNKEFAESHGLTNEDGNYNPYELRLEQAKEFYENLYGIHKDGQENINESEGEFEENSSGFWNRLADNTAEVQKRMSNDGSEWQKSASTTWDQVVQNEKDAHARLDTDRSQWIAEWGPKFSEAWNTIKEAFSNGWDAVVSWWNGSVVSWWTDSVAPWFTAEKWAEAFGNIKLSLEQKWAELVAWWNSSALVEWWTNDVTPWFSADKWAELFGNIESSLKTAWDQLSSWWESSTLVLWWENNVQPWFTKEKWLELFDAIPQSLNEEWEKVNEKLSGLPQEMFDFGVAIVQGLVDGVKSLFGSAVDTIGEIANGVKDFFADLLGIHSPSTVFEEYGQYVVEGLNRGIANTDSTQIVAAWIASVQAMFAPEKWTPVFSGITQAFQTAWAELTGWFSENAEVWLETVREKFSPEMWSGILLGAYTAFETVFTQIFTYIDAEWALIEANTKNWWTNITTYLNSVFLNLQEYIKLYWTGFYEFINQTWTTLQLDTFEIWTLISEFMLTTFEELRILTEETWTGFYDFISEGWSQIELNTTETWQRISEFYSNTLKNMLSLTEINMKAIKTTSENYMNIINKTIIEKLTNTKIKWYSLWGTFPGAVESAFGQVKGIAESSVSYILDLIGQLASAISGIMSSIGSLGGAIAGAFSGIPSGINLAGGISLNIPGFAGGGMPEKGSLFWANENNKPELVGSIGGRTAVANNDQITNAIAAAVGPAVRQGMLSALSEAAEKGNDKIEVHIDIDGREFLTIMSERDKRNGFNFATGNAGNGFSFA